MTRKMKSAIFAVVAAIVLTSSLSLLSACGGNDDSLMFMAYSPANDTAKQIYNDIIADFTAETGIKVKPVYVPKDSYNTKLKSNFRTADSKPDVFYLDQPMLADYVNQCLCLDEGFFAAESEQGLHKSDFFSSAMDTAVYKGACYAVPLSLTTSVLLYNKSLVSAVPTNWNDWGETEVPSGKALFGGIGNGGYSSWYFQAFLKSAGGEMVKNDQPVFNNEQGVNAAQMLVNLYAKSPKTVRESSNSFTNGNVMYVLAHSADIANYYSGNPTWCTENMGASLFIPQTEGGVSYSNIGGENLAIRKDSGKEANAAAFVKYLLKEENLAKTVGTNFPAIKAFAKINTSNPITGEAVSQVVQDALRVVLGQLDTASARPAVKNWTLVNDTYLANALSDILDNGKSIQTALDTAVDQAKSVLNFD